MVIPQNKNNGAPHCTKNMFPFKPNEIIINTKKPHNTNNSVCCSGRATE